MLFSYPIEATHENWLHECLVEMLASIHDKINKKLIWPAIIPDLHREKLTSRTSLRDRLETYRKAARKLTKQQRELILETLEKQNKIPELLAGTSNCLKIEELPLTIQAPIKDLFGQAFTLLTGLGIRDRHYKLIHTAIKSKLCPFCGCEQFDAPGSKREALDHYLAESIYPFAAANLINLVPMGEKCNSRYKLSLDILETLQGVRRTSFFAYNAPGLGISLDNSVVADGLNIELISQWVIEFTETSQKVDTWDTVFSIRQRYTRDILEIEIESWLSEFSAWRQSLEENVVTDQDVIRLLQRYAIFMEKCGFSDRAFLKAAVFRMLHKHSADGNQRIIRLARLLTESSLVS